MSSTSFSYVGFHVCRASRNHATGLSRRSPLPFVTVCTLLGIFCAAPGVAFAQTTYVGKDAGAASLATSPNSVAAAAAFDAAIPGTAVVTFERGTATQTSNGATTTVLSSGVSFVLTNQSTSPPALYDQEQIANYGFNTTAGGSTRLYSASADLSLSRTTTVTFSNAVSAFGAYIGGVGNAPGQLTLTYNDGVARSFDLTSLLGNANGGNGFFGVSGGGNFTMLTFTLVPGSGGSDSYSIDDFRYRTVTAAAAPEPNTVATMSFAVVATGLFVVGRSRRKSVQEAR